MPHDVTMPQLGMAQDAGKIVAWLKAEGDAVAKGDALLEVETDKAVMEVEAQAAGFLTGVVAGAGEDVPVGQVIAQISESADAPAAEAGGAEAAVPEGRTITMPQLGMAQDSAVLVGWTKALGEAVDADDILFEVETDKSTMEVPAGVSGYLAATLAEPGEEIPVGDPVAVISTEKPEATVARGAGSGPKALSSASALEVTVAAPPKAAAEAAAPAAAPAPAVQAPAARHTPGGRILASPKARRLARERGLDLERLVRAGHPQPYHVADLEVLAALPAEAPAATGAAQAISLTAHIAADGLADFTAWAAQAHGLGDADALLAGMAGASLPGAAPLVVAIARHGITRPYGVPASRALSKVAPSDDAATLTVRDLRHTALRGFNLGAEATPTLTLMTSDAGGLTVSLECSPAQLSPDDAIHLLTQFAGRMDSPLHHLL